MDTPVTIALVGNAVSLLALAVTQVNGQRNESRRLKQARLSRLADARRCAYVDFLRACDETIRRTDERLRDPWGEPSPADLYPGYDDVIEDDLARVLASVELLGDEPTTSAARQFAQLVSRYSYTEEVQWGDAASAARSSFTDAARADLEVHPRRRWPWHRRRTASTEVQVTDPARTS